MCFCFLWCSLDSLNGTIILTFSLSQMFSIAIVRVRVALVRVTIAVTKRDQKQLGKERLY